MSEVSEYIDCIKDLDEQRDKLNSQEHYGTEFFDIQDYSDAWGCEATFDEVDNSLEQRAESLMYKLSDALAFSFEEAAAYYHQQIYNRLIGEK
jgi:hypothetical protein